MPDLLDSLRAWGSGQPAKLPALDADRQQVLEQAFPLPVGIKEQFLQDHPEARSGIHDSVLVDVPLPLELPTAWKPLAMQPETVNALKAVAEAISPGATAVVSNCQTEPDEYYQWPDLYSYTAGVAGTGKTFLTRERVRQSEPGTCVVMASTGIAATNLGDAVTINSQLGYFDTASMEQSYTHGVLQAKLRRMRAAGVRRLILDELSMFEAQQLTCLVRALEELNNEAGVLANKNPGWGLDSDARQQPLGLTLLGDFCQLMPVQGDYAFLSPEWHRFTIETLTEIRRQGDAAFIAALSAVRSEHIDQAIEYFRPRLHQVQDPNFDGTTIVAKNLQVDRINRLRYDQLTGTPVDFANTRWGKERGEWKYIPPLLQLKPQAQVMLLSNRYEGDSGMRELLYANGDNGVFLGKDLQGNAVVQLTRTGQPVAVRYITRENKIPRKDPVYICANKDCAKKMDSGHTKRCPDCGSAVKKDLYEIIGEITYLPLRLAYATTTHKSQGLTLDRCQVAIGDGFFKSPGLTYVALSRVRSIEGLRLVGTVDQLRARIKMDPRTKPWR